MVGSPAGTMVMSAISRIPVDEVDRVNIGVSDDDAYRREQHNPPVPSRVRA